MHQQLNNSTLDNWRETSPTIEKELTQDLLLQSQQIWNIKKINQSGFATYFIRIAMPRLSPVQREQAIGRLNVGQRPQVVTDAINCNIQTVQRYNAKKKRSPKSYNASTGMVHLIDLL